MFDELFSRLTLRHDNLWSSQHLTPREVGVITKRCYRYCQSCPALPGVGYEELLKVSGDYFGIPLTWMKMKLVAVLLGWLLALTGEAMKSWTFSVHVVDYPLVKKFDRRIINPIGWNLWMAKAGLVVSERFYRLRTSPAIMNRAALAYLCKLGIKVMMPWFGWVEDSEKIDSWWRKPAKRPIALDTIFESGGKECVCAFMRHGQRASGFCQNHCDVAVKQGRAGIHRGGGNRNGKRSTGLAYLAALCGYQYCWAPLWKRAAKYWLFMTDLTLTLERIVKCHSCYVGRPVEKAFPGWYFSLFTRGLLERADALSAELGGSFMTRYRLSKTESEDISAYIQTNLMSITDGQIYLSPRLFETGVFGPHRWLGEISVLVWDGKAPKQQRLSKAWQRF